MEMIKKLVICLSLLATTVQSQVVSPEQLFQQSERRQRVIDEQFNPITDERLIIDLNAIPQSDDTRQEVCINIDGVVLEVFGEANVARRFSDALLKTLANETFTVTTKNQNYFQIRDKSQPKTSRTQPCLGVERIERIALALQNRLLEDGLITTRVLVPEQDLNQGQLTLSIIEGKIGTLQLVSSNKEAVDGTDGVLLGNSFPTQSEDLLNLRDLEQGLENLRRLPTVSAQIDIAPSDVANYSDIAVNWQQRQYPFRLNLSLDNSGSEATGKILGTINVAWDNPLHFSDLLYFSYTRNLTPGAKQTDIKGNIDKGKTDNYAINYSLPLGYWSLGMGMSDYYYDQVVAGINRNYHYTGDSTSGNVNLSRVLYRDNQHKISATINMWGKSNKSYIDDAEIEVQRRRTGGWKAGVSQRSYFKLGTLTSRLDYKRGTRAFGAIPAPEELFDEGTGKMKIWTADIDWQMPFSLGNQNFSWHSHFHGQWNKSLLTSQDRIAIGGRYSVRGFNGEKSLSGERGWYWRNDLSWRYQDNHQVYLGLDTGQVSGVSSSYLPGKNLTGVALGLKGQFKKGGDWYYDIFFGAPLHQPEGFEADSVVFGFNFNYSL